MAIKHPITLGRCYRSGVVALACAGILWLARIPAFADYPGQAGSIMAPCEQAWLANNWPAVAVGCESAARNWALGMDQVEAQIQSYRDQATILNGGTPDYQRPPTPNGTAVIDGMGTASIDVAVGSGMCLARSAYAYYQLHHAQKADAQRARAVTLLLETTPASNTSQGTIDEAAALLKALQAPTFYSNPEALE